MLKFFFFIIYLFKLAGEIFHMTLISKISTIGKADEIANLSNIGYSEVSKKSKNF